MINDTFEPEVDPLAPITNIKMVIANLRGYIERNQAHIDALSREITEIQESKAVTKAELKLYEKALALLESSHT